MRYLNAFGKLQILILIQMIKDCVVRKHQIWEHDPEGIFTAALSKENLMQIANDHVLFLNRLFS